MQITMLPKIFWREELNFTSFKESNLENFQTSFSNPSPTERRSVKKFIIWNIVSVHIVENKSNNSVPL